MEQGNVGTSWTLVVTEFGLQSFASKVRHGFGRIPGPGLGGCCLMLHLMTTLQIFRIQTPVCVAMCKIMFSVEWFIDFCDVYFFGVQVPKYSHWGWCWILTLMPLPCFWSSFFAVEKKTCDATRRACQVCSVWKVSGSKGWEEALWENRVWFLDLFINVDSNIDYPLVN